MAASPTPVYPGAEHHHINTRISLQYVTDWKLREALREVVTNFFDELHKLYPRKTEIRKELIDRVQPARVDHNNSPKTVVGHSSTSSTINIAIDDSMTGFSVRSLARVNPETNNVEHAGDFDMVAFEREQVSEDYFRTKEVVVGTIRWGANTLRITNPGNLTSANFLMGGGTKKPTPDAEPGVSGQFGEGLKLAMLACIREERKKFKIYSSGLVTEALLLNVPLMDKHVCLHLDETTDKDPNNKGKVIVEIQNITLEEWLGNHENNQGVHGFLPLIGALRRIPQFEDDDPREVYGTKGSAGGCLFLNPRYDGRIFNNGVFMCRANLNFGYGLVGLKPNRDRHVLVDVTQQRAKCAELLSDIIENYPALFHSQKYLETLSSFDLLGRVFELLNKNQNDTWDMPGKSGVFTANFLFEYWIMKLQVAAPSSSSSSSAAAAAPASSSSSSSSGAPEAFQLISPLPFEHFRTMPSENVSQDNQSLLDRFLSLSTRPVSAVSWQLKRVLQKSHYFRTIDQRVSDLMAIPEVKFPSDPFTEKIVPVLNNLLRISNRQSLELKFLNFGSTDAARYHIAFKVGTNPKETVYLSHELLNPATVRLREPGMVGEDGHICAVKIFSTIIQLGRPTELPQLFSAIFASALTLPHLE